MAARSSRVDLLDWAQPPGVRPDDNVLQAAASATVGEACLPLRLFALELPRRDRVHVAVSRGFLPFVAAVLPAVFVLGVFTVVRLVDTGIENLHVLRGIARSRGYYRTLTPEAATYFSAESGRWPLSRPSSLPTNDSGTTFDAGSAVKVRRDVQIAAAASTTSSRAGVVRGGGPRPGHRNNLGSHALPALRKPASMSRWSTPARWAVALWVGYARKSAMLGARCPTKCPAPCPGPSGHELAAREPPHQHETPVRRLQSARRATEDSNL